MALTKVVKRMEDDLRAIKREVETKQRMISEKKQLLLKRKERISSLQEEAKSAKNIHQQHLSTATILEDNIDARKIDIVKGNARIAEKKRQNRLFYIEVMKKKAALEGENKKMEELLHAKLTAYQNLPKAQELAALEAERSRLQNLLKVLKMKQCKLPNIPVHTFTKNFTSLTVPNFLIIEEPKKTSDRIDSAMDLVDQSVNKSVTSASSGAESTNKMLAGSLEPFISSAETQSAYVPMDIENATEPVKFITDQKTNSVSQFVLPPDPSRSESPAKLSGSRVASAFVKPNIPVNRLRVCSKNRDEVQSPSQNSCNEMPPPNRNDLPRTSPTSADDWSGFSGFEAPKDNMFSNSGFPFSMGSPTNSEDSSDSLSLNAFFNGLGGGKKKDKSVAKGNSFSGFLF